MIEARTESWEMFTSRHRNAVWAAVLVGVAGGLAAGAHLLAKRLDI